MGKTCLGKIKGCMYQKDAGGIGWEGESYLSVNEKIIMALKSLNIPISVMENTKKGLSEFIVLIPLTDRLSGYSDNKPSVTYGEAELALYTKGNYIPLRDEITRLLLEADIGITERRYIEYETETGYHHYIIDALVAEIL